jgi:hypothetical protein
MRVLRSSNLDSMNDPDFVLMHNVNGPVVIELKTRRQTPGPVWRSLRPETRWDDLFILDELTVRKLVRRAPHAYLLIADMVPSVTRWVALSIGDLLVIDKTRVSRPLYSGGLKGKWLIDLSDAPVMGEDLSVVVNEMGLLTDTVQSCWGHIGLWPVRERGHGRGAA